jgi:hypothetical protein
MLYYLLQQRIVRTAQDLLYQIGFFLGLHPRVRHKK